MQNHIEPDDPLSVRIRDKFFPGLEILSVPIIERMKTAQCYANVCDYVTKHGGTSQMGWLLTAIPGKFVEATHHSVWRSPTGELFDVTGAAFSAMTNLISTFIVDLETPPPEDYWHPTIPSWFLVLSDDATTKSYVRATRLKIQTLGLLMREARLLGFRMERMPDQQVYIVGKGPTNDRFQDLQKKFEEVSSEKDRLSAALLRR
ncbi:hypothetical protein FLX27_21885 [Agrobacterium tumefaciens]|nr:hypothetical protein [Agrobacterium tumefaciens]TQN59566.1 hypothetical protein FLX27_21885 [Agrobacterium tumefaciens]